MPSFDGQSSVQSPYRPHPWHGLSLGPEPPRIVSAYIEITPFDSIKYELDKTTGYLRVDRPQRTSSLPPALYGFIPRTLCAERFCTYSPHARRGDGDPLDICVISERAINKSEIVLTAKVVGGLQMVDHGEADDKIIAILQNDLIWAHIQDVTELPGILAERLQHYFSTYKLVPGEESQTAIDATYGHEHAWCVIEAAMADYRDAFPGPG